jgi:hypothetical protein
MDPGHDGVYVGWADRLHGNSEGHRRISLALAEALDVPVDEDWRDPLPEVSRRLVHTLVGEAGRVAGHLLAWAVRRVRGQSSGETVTCKRPELLPL